MAARKRILSYDDDLTENALTELQAMMPDTKQVRSFPSSPFLTPSLTDAAIVQEIKLSQYKSLPQRELDFLEPADRFLIECMKMYRIAPRIKAMIYRERFLENIGNLESVRPPQCDLLLELG